MCLWNDTREKISYELQWKSQFLSPVRNTLQPGSAFGHGLILNNPDDGGLPLKIRFKQGSSGTYGAWLSLAPVTTTTLNCWDLRGDGLHYEFKGGTVQGGFRLVGPTSDP